MNKYFAMAVLVLFSTLGLCQDDDDENEGLVLFSGVESFEVDETDPYTGEMDSVKNVTVGIQGMVYSDRFREYPLYFGLGANVTNVNGRNDSAYTIVGEVGFRTNIFTPYVAIAYTNDLGEDGDSFNEIDTDQFYIEDTNVGIGLMVNNPIEDSFSAKLTLNVLGNAGEAGAAKLDLYYRLPKSRADGSAPVFSIGLKQRGETSIELRDGTERVRASGSGITLSVGMSINF